MLRVENVKSPKMTVPDRRIAFANRVRTVREAAGLTQTEVARAAGMSRPYYVQVESGRHSVSIDLIFAIADALSVTAGELFAEES